MNVQKLSDVHRVYLKKEIKMANYYIKILALQITTEMQVKIIMIYHFPF